MISYDYYKVFYYVCKYKNFTKAANVLMTSQSSVSHTMQNLEHQLGCRLFTRNNRGIELTTEGEHLFEYVSIGCEQFIKGESELLSSISLESGIVYIGATETALHCFLFDALDAFHINFPNVKFKIHNYSTTEAINSLKNGVVDFAITAGPVEVYSHMKCENLKEFQDILIGGNRYAHLKKSQISLEYLTNFPIISFSSGTKSREFIDSLFSAHNIPFYPSIECATSDLILPMVKHNLGVGFIPKSIATEAINRGEVFQIPLKETIPTRNVCLIHDSHHPHSIASKEFEKFIIYFSKNS